MASMSYYEPKTNVRHIKILRRVIAKIKEDVGRCVDMRSFTSRVTSLRYTGLHPKNIEYIEKSGDVDVELRELDRSVVYQKLMDFNIETMTMPTTQQLFTSLANDLPMYMHIGTFRKTLAKMGFMWKLITPGLVVVMERPRIIYERVNYLKNIIRYRRKKFPIYYIEENTVEMSAFGNNVQQKIIYTVSETGIQFIQKLDDYNAETCLQWVKDTLLMSVTTPSVFILNNAAHHCEEIVKMPTAESTKKVMTDWLDFFKVPYDSEMPKVILHDLIRKYTDTTKKIYKIDAILEAHGHIVLRIPNNIFKVNPGDLVYQTLQNNVGIWSKEPKEVTTVDMFDEMASVINEDLAKKFTEAIAEEELRIITMDLNLDDIFDALHEKMINKGKTIYVDSDIPSSDSE